MSASAIVIPKAQFNDDDGNPLAYGFLISYQSGTNVYKVTYKDEGGENENTPINGVTRVDFNQGGQAEVYLKGSYKIVVFDSEGNEQWTQDPVTQNQLTGASGSGGITGLTVKSGKVDNTTPDAPEIYNELQAYACDEVGTTGKWSVDGAENTPYTSLPPKAMIITSASFSNISASTTLFFGTSQVPLKRQGGGDLVSGDLKANTFYLILGSELGATGARYEVQGVCQSAGGLDSVVLQNTSGYDDPVSSPGTVKLYPQLMKFEATKFGVNNLWYFDYSPTGSIVLPTSFIVFSSDWTGVNSSTSLSFPGAQAVPQLKGQFGADIASADLVNGQEYICVLHKINAATFEYHLQGVGMGSAGGVVDRIFLGNNSGFVEQSSDPAQPIIWPELQNALATQAGATDIWNFPYTTNPASPPESLIISSNNWSAIGPNTRLEVVGLGGWPLKRYDGTDLQDGDLVARRKYIVIVNYPSSASPFYAVQGVGVRSTFAVALNNNSISVSGSTCYLYRGNDRTDNSPDGACTNSTGIANGNIISIGAGTGLTVTSVNIKAPKMSVSQPTVGSNPVVDLIFYQNTGTGWVSIDGVSVPVVDSDIALVGVSNDAGGTTMINAKATGLNIVIPDDVLWGVITAPSSTNNNKINLVGKLTVTIAGEVA